jgi:predicted metal-binding protein
MRGEAMVRKIVEQVSDDILRADLDRYIRRAIELGATDAKVITSTDVIIDERVRAKCSYPMCSSYGTNVNCPPYAPSLDQVRRLVNAFCYGVFVKLDAPFEEQLNAWRDTNLRNHEIISRIEADAFYDGYYLAVGFGGRACKNVFCPDLECSALATGQACRYPLKSRPTAHAMGMDLFKMATRLGWDMYPIGKSTLPSDVPCLTTLGIVLIY